VITVSQDSVFFDTTAVGESDTVALEIQNVGLQDLEVLDVIAPGNVFFVTRTSFPVAFGTHEIVNLIFAPPTSGNYAGLIQIAHNVANQDTINVYVQGTTGPPLGISEDSELPGEFAISQNYPNPFNPATTLRIQLPRLSDVKLVIYNTLGQKVRTLVNGKLSAGYHDFVWDGSNDLGQLIASGIYIYRFEAGEYRQTKKMILLR
jgi:hypothetical protein